MKLVVTRKTFDDNCTLGELSIDGAFSCYTLEPMVRPVGAEKIFGKTAIPYGEYSISITYSNKMGRNLPLLADVPNFEGVRIHPGNFPADTEGCLLVGESEGQDAVLNSRVAFESVFNNIQSALTQGDTVTILYQDVQPVAPVEVTPLQAEA